MTIQNRENLVKTLKLILLSVAMSVVAAANVLAQDYRTDINPALLYYKSFILAPDWSLAALVVFAPAPRAPLPGPVMANTLPPPVFSSDLSPTVANYQMVANRSLDKLDDLLTRQGNRNTTPASIYTASDFARANLSE
jgi:hypothetical protein